MDQWREAGYSGRKHDNKLWEAFQGARDVFYTNFHSQQHVNKEDRLEEIETELENVNAQIDSLELLNETIVAKYDNVLNRTLPSEDHESYEEENEAKRKTNTCIKKNMVQVTTLPIRRLFPRAKFVICLSNKIIKISFKK